VICDTWEVHRLEVYARFRRAVQVDGISKRQAPREFGLSRKMIRNMLEYTATPGYQRKKPVARPKLGPWLGVVDQFLEDDHHQRGQFRIPAQPLE
jgi:hypothetical protein